MQNDEVLTLPLDYSAIERILPHRYPFLLVDRITEFETDTRIVGIKNVTINELIVEAMAQTCGAIVARRFSGGKRKLVYFMTIDEAKFRKPVVPGDVLELKVNKLKQRGNIFRFDCKAQVGEAKVAEAIISAMMVDPEDAA